MLGNLPGPPKVGAAPGGEHEVAGAGRAEQLQQLARRVGPIGAAGAHQELTVLEQKGRSAQAERVTAQRLVADAGAVLREARARVPGDHRHPPPPLPPPDPPPPPPPQGEQRLPQPPGPPRPRPGPAPPPPAAQTDPPP